MGCDDGESIALVTVRPSSSASTTYRSGHSKKWLRKEYKVGKVCRGGYWLCCGVQDKLCLGCTEEMREAWRRKEMESDANEAANAVRRALAQERRRQWEESKSIPLLTKAEAKNVLAAPISFTDERRRSSAAVRMPGRSSIEHYTFSEPKMKFKEHNVPMLVRSFGNGSEWEIGESLAAALTMLDDETGRQALLRHGMVTAIKLRFFCVIMYPHHVSAEEKKEEPLSACRLAMCAKILAALATCRLASKGLVDDRELSILALHRLKQLKVKEAYSEMVDLMQVISTTTHSSRPTQSFMNNSAIPYQGIVLPRLDSHPLKFLNFCIHQALESSINGTLDTREHCFTLVRLGLESVQHIGKLGSSTRDLLKNDFSIIQLCLDSITLIRRYMDVHMAGDPAADCASAALSAAVALLCQMAVDPITGNIDPLVVSGMRDIYDTIRSQLSRTDIQIQGLHLLCTLAHTDDGARELDKIQGAWQWLGRSRIRCHPDGGPYDWCCAEDPSYTPLTNFHVNTSSSWSSTRLALFLDMRIPGDNHLNAIVDQLHVLSLLPFESEKPGAWKRRVQAFERRNNMKLLTSLDSINSNNKTSIQSNISYAYITDHFL